MYPDRTRELSNWCMNLTVLSFMAVAGGNLHASRRPQVMLTLGAQKGRLDGSI